MSGFKYLPQRLIKTQETQANNSFYQLIQCSGSMCRNNYQEHCWSVIGLGAEPVDSTLKRSSYPW